MTTTQPPNHKPFLEETTPMERNVACARQPPPKSNHFTNSNWAVVLNPCIITTITDLSLHAKDFGDSDKLTTFEFVACTDKWKESDCAIIWQSLP